MPIALTTSSPRAGFGLRNPHYIGALFHNRNAVLEWLMSIGTILLIVLILLLLAAFPAWPYSRSWGYYPSGFLGALLLIVIVLLLLGVFPKTA